MASDAGRFPGIPQASLRGPGKNPPTPDNQLQDPKDKSPSLLTDQKGWISNIFKPSTKPNVPDVPSSGGRTVEPVVVQPPATTASTTAEVVTSAMKKFWATWVWN